MLAPVIIFVYNRLEHVKKCIDALSSNPLANQTKLYIYSDGPKDIKDIIKINSIREYFNHINKLAFFKSYEVFNSKKNQGLAISIINGVTRVIKKHKRVIVIEDDVIVSPQFLNYMNECLKIYEKNPKIGAIGAFTIPIKFPKYFNEDVFLSYRGSSCAWGTWDDRWDKIDWKVKDYKEFKYNCFKRQAFNRFAPDRALMLDEQMAGLIDSWAIRFSYGLFKNRLYWVMPKNSKVKNIGFDGSGTHCGASNKYEKIAYFRESTKENYYDAKFYKEITLEYKKHFQSKFGLIKNIYKFIKIEFINLQRRLSKKFSI